MRPRRRNAPHAREIADMKKFLSLFLAVWMSLNVCVLSAGAETQAPEADAVFAAAGAGDVVELIVYDLLKIRTDPLARVCYTIEIFFQNQFCNYDASKPITFCDVQSNVAAVCRPHAAENRVLDLYTPDGRFGVTLDPTRLYFLTIPEGAYTTDDGILSGAYSGEYTGVYLAGAQPFYTVLSPGIREFYALQYDETHLYTGRLHVSGCYDTAKTNLPCIRLYRIDGDKRVLLGAYSIREFSKKSGARIAFDGVEIDKYKSYVLRVCFGTFTGPQNVVNDNFDYPVSGKKLLNLREDYPALDLLIRWFGAGHRVLKVVLTVLKVLSFLKIIDKALYNDIDKYISDRK